MYCYVFMGKCPILAWKHEMFFIMQISEAINLLMQAYFEWI